MARIRTADGTLQAQLLPSVGAFASTSGRYLDHEAEPERRELANAGSPVVCR